MVYSKFSSCSYLCCFNLVVIKNFELISILFICLLSCSKDKLDTNTFYKGSNNVTPTKMITPHFSDHFSYSFKLGNEWNDTLLCTDRSHGFKGFAIGGKGLNTNYHESGINTDIMWDADSGLVFHPRYYIDKTLHVLSGICIMTGVWYRVTIQANPLKWTLDAIVWTADGKVDHSYLTPIYIGKKGIATAERDLTIQLR